MLIGHVAVVLYLVRYSCFYKTRLQRKNSSTSMYSVCQITYFIWKARSSLDYFVHCKFRLLLLARGISGFLQNCFYSFCNYDRFSLHCSSCWRRYGNKEKGMKEWSFFCLVYIISILKKEIYPKPKNLHIEPYVQSNII